MVAEAAGVIAVRVSSSAATPSFRRRRPPDVLTERVGGWGARTERVGPNPPRKRIRIDTTILAWTSHEWQKFAAVGAAATFALFRAESPAGVACSPSAPSLIRDLEHPMSGIAGVQSAWVAPSEAGRVLSIRGSAVPACG
jgi:hypothetical protein